MQCFGFNSRVRKTGESVSTYVADLRRLTEDCNYSNTLEMMIRDRIVWCSHGKIIQNKFLRVTNLTYVTHLSSAE